MNLESHLNRWVKIGVAHQLRCFECVIPIPNLLLISLLSKAQPDKYRSGCHADKVETRDAKTVDQAQL